MSKYWTFKPLNSDKADKLFQELPINKTLCCLLVQRNIDNYEKARHFFRPDLKELHDPWLMKDMDLAVNRICKALEDKEKILVYGDYDVDGTTSVACMYQFLNQIGTEKPDYYIPDRYKEGYGISKQGVDFAAQKGFTLVIALDCGIKSNELIDYANEKKIDFIICDHHMPRISLPKAIAVLDPKRKDCNYPYKELCGCAVGFKLMEAISRKLNIDQKKYQCYLDLVATAICADIVPITGENRILAYWGIRKISKSPSYGMKALKNISGIKEDVSATDMGFSIAPKINAAGRMDDARIAVKLFISTSDEEAMFYAAQLHRKNAERKETDTSITKEALELIDNQPDLQKRKTTVLYHENWHKGVVGIVASRLMETYFRPTIVLSKSGGLLTGSARSVPGFNLYKAIDACGAYLTNYGGHFAAAGMSLKIEDFESFSEAFEKQVEATIQPEMLIPEITIDLPVTLRELTKSFYNIIKQMEPFGPLNEEPVFFAKEVRDSGYSRIVKENHIQFSVNQHGVNMKGIGFRMADKFQIVSSGQPFDMIFTLAINDWRDKQTVELRVLDIRASNALSN